MTNKNLHQFTEAEKADIQGYITSGFTHLDYAAYVFLQIVDASKAKKWLVTQLDNDKITSAATWPKDEQGRKIKPSATLNVAFTHDGLAEMGLAQESLDTFSPEFQEGMVTDTRSRNLGDVGDSAPEHWELGGPNTPTIHLVLVMFDSSPEAIESRLTGINAENGLVVLQVEHGGCLPNNREHFGFRDGIGQPKIEGIVNPKKVDRNVVATGEFVLGYINAYDFYPVSPTVPNIYDTDEILPPDPNPFHLNAFRDFGRNGTYMVYRKLEQNVVAYWSFIAENADKLPQHPHGKAAAMVWLAAKTVGRWPSGAPLVLSPDAEPTDIPFDKFDEFNYMETDEFGLAAPYGSHVRRMHPRDSLLPKKTDKSLKTSGRHRIMRRGMPYGTPLFDHRILTDKNRRDELDQLLTLTGDHQPRGLHFGAVMSNIQRQFELLQHSWSNHPNFNGMNQNKDPLIGDNDNGDSYMMIPNEPKAIRTTAMPRFVTVKGGAYLFVPSLRALRYLASL